MSLSFSKGDIVELVATKRVSNKQINHMRSNVRKMNPNKLIVLRAVEPNIYLVALSYRSRKKTQLQVKTNDGSYFVNTRRFFTIDTDAIRCCESISFKDSRLQVVNDIYDSHNAEVLSMKLKREERQRKRMELKIPISEVEHYAKLYEMAVISNDRHAMQTIVDKVGCVPLMKGGARSASKSIYEVNNPRPYVGGRFSPK